MPGEDLHADGDEHESADDFHDFAETLAEPGAEEHAHHGERGRDAADDEGGIPHDGPEHGEGQPDGERVDAGGHGQQHQAPATGRVAALRALFFPVGQRLVNRPAPHKREQRKGDPVAVAADVPRGQAAERPAQNRHERLEQSKMEGQPEHLARRHAAQAHARADGHRQRVHGQADGNAGQGQEIHAGKALQGQGESAL